MDFGKGKPGLSQIDECRESNGHKYFGIKSYLHNFYENVRNPGDLDDFFDDDSSASHVKDGRNKRSTCWTATLIASFLAMFGGAVMLLIGFTFPRMKIDIGYQEEMRIIDKSAFAFNEHLNQIKVFGLVMFAVGGTLVSSMLLLPALLCANDEDDADESTHFKVRIHDDDFEHDDGATKNLIPITEKLKVVQPRQESTTITTKAGLKQID